MGYNQGKFDGFPVDLYEGRFSGTFEVEDEIGEKIAYDDVVTFLVVTSADKATISSMKSSGDIKRTNTFAVANAQVVPVELAAKFFNELKEEMEKDVNDEPTFWDNDPGYEDSDFLDDDYNATVTDPDGNVRSVTVPWDLVEEAPDDEVVVVSKPTIQAADPDLAAFLNEEPEHV